MNAPLATRHLSIRLTDDGERFTTVRLTRRVVDVTRALPGRPAGAAPDILAALLPVCGMAHRAAALGALEAQGIVCGYDRRHLSMAVAAERAANGIWRLGFDGAAALGLGPRARAVAIARSAARGVASRSVPITDAIGSLEDAHAMVSDITVALAGNVARMDGRIQRFMARAADDPAVATDLLAGLSAGIVDPERHCGTGGKVETSRGALAHCCLIENGMVRSWTIETPTDHMTAHGGVLHGMLTGLEHGGQPLETARMVVALVDPCEGVDIVIDREAGDA